MLWAGIFGEGEDFRIRPDRRWAPPSLLYVGHWACFPCEKRREVVLSTQCHLQPGLKKE